jgi:hypothetical protein
MDSIVFGFLPPKMQQQILQESAEAARRTAERRVTQLTNWDPQKTIWAKELNLRASTYRVYDLFPRLKPTEQGRLPCDCKKGEYADSAKGKFRYLRRRLPARTTLKICSGKRIGSVLFDEDIIIPALYERPSEDLGGWKCRYGQESPWMSLTPPPNEILTLRPGTRLAKGHTVVAGLGLGHQLLDVLRRKKVTQVTLVEKSQELAEWILPRLRSAYPNIDWSKLAVEIGDAYKVIPKLTADVCLLDIFPDYGGNSYGAFKLECCFRDAGRPDSIPRIWAWGSAQV